MHYRYLLATSAFSNPGLLDKCLKSWLDIYVVDKLVFVDKDTGKFDHLWHYLDNSYKVIKDSTHNGVSGAWNTISEYAFKEKDYDALIVVGSDTEIVDPTFVKEFIEEFENEGLEFSTTSFPIGYNCWCMTKKCYEVVGQWDKGLFIYYEDNDMDYRIKLSGLPMGCIGNSDKINHFGSATIRLDGKYAEANGTTFSMNQQYYIKKWGGVPSKETFKHPYNNPNLTFKDWVLNEEELKIKKDIWSK